MGRIKCSIYHQTWQNSIPWSVFWVAAYIIWCITTIVFYFGVPVLISLVTFYLGLKLYSIIKNLDHLNQVIRYNKQLPNNSHHNQRMIFRINTNQRFTQLIHRYNELYAENILYNHVISKCLTIIVSGFTAIITYCTYLTLMTQMPRNIRIAYKFVLITHVGCLVMIIGICNWLVNLHRQFGQKLIRFCQISAQSTIFSYRQFFKVN